MYGFWGGNNLTLVSGRNKIWFKNESCYHLSFLGEADGHGRRRFGGGEMHWGLGEFVQ